MKNILIVLFLTVASFGVEAAPVGAEAYGRLPAFADVDLSPTGKFMAAKIALEGEYILGIYELPIKSDSKSWFKRYEDGRIRWINWANDERLLVAIEFTDSVKGVPILQTRLISINYDGTKPKNMVRQTATELVHLTQFQDEVLDMLPDDPDNILMAFSKDVTQNNNPEVRRVNVYSGKSKLVEGSHEDISSWLSDRNGVVRAGFGIHDDTLKMILRDGENGEWRDVSNRFLSKASNEFDDTVTFSPMGFDKDPNIIYMLSNHESDTAAVYRYDIAADKFVEKVYGRDDVDISGLEYDSTGENVVGIRYVADEPEIHYLADDADARLRENISKMFNGDEVRLASTTYDNAKWIVRVSGSQNPGGFFYVDKQIPKVTKIGDLYPELSTDGISPIEVSSYLSRDNVDIPAYLTLPADTPTLTSARKIPFIVLPHGGPAARDFKRFDFLPQFLASRGYGVFQMNFRGSTGYGTEFKLAGSREWGEVMQDDVSDGVKWLVESGYADRDRICIVGWSYGAYAALAGSMKTPELYRCAVGIAGVYDLPRLIRSTLRYRNGEFMTRHIGRLWSDKEKLESNSPARHANDITIPVLIMHAADDRVVPIMQSRLMRDALSDSGNDWRYLEFEKGGHSLVSADRIKMLAQLEFFLAMHIAQ